jgi:PAS domain S-box-containing protein
VNAEKNTPARIADDSLRSVIETADAIVVVLDASGEIQLVNRALEEITGYTRSDLEGRSWFETLVPKERYPDVWEEFRRLTSGGIPKRFENPILTKNGEERYIVWRNSDLERQGEIVGTVSVGIDITERKRAEEALELSEEKLEAIFQSAPAGVAVSEIESGQLLDVNEEFERLFEHSREEVLGKSKLGLGLWVDPADRARVIEVLEKEGHVEHLEAQMQSLSGKKLTVVVNARLLTLRGSRFLVLALRDVTEERQMQRQVEMLKHSIDVHNDGIYWMNADNEIIYVNEAGCRMLGYEATELIGQTIDVINPGATHVRMESTWEKLRNEGFFATESVHRRRDGSTFPVEIRSTYVRFGGQEYNVGFARDISQRKRREQERAQLTEQLTQAQKMEAIGRLAGGVAHNFNNILTALVGYCELLLAKLPADSDSRFEAEQIKRAAEHATTVTRELLLFSRREAGQLAKLDLNEVVVQTRLLLRELIRSDIEIVTALAPVVAPVMADRSQIEQVIVNLVLNASDAISSGGVIGLETANLDLDERLVERGAVLEPGRYVTLTVKDDGAGMDEDTLARIFEPFFSTKSPDKGSGLGLSTVYGIVEESRGKILVDSKPGAGTKFTICLPALPGRS